MVWFSLVCLRGLWEIALSTWWVRVRHCLVVVGLMLAAMVAIAGL